MTAQKTAEAAPTVVVGVPTVEARVSSIDQYATSTDLYPIARGMFAGSTSTYLLQGLNGPCPLLAVANVLLLRGTIEVGEAQADISFNELVSKISTLVRESAKSSNSSPTSSSVDEAIAMLGSLNKGLDVDITFREVDGFVDSRGISIFPLLKVAVLHGWIVSDDDLDAYPYVSPLSYNQAVEKVARAEELKVRALESGNFDLPPEFKEEILEGEAIAKWMDQTANQLTSDGVIELNARLVQGELGVLFRNNHFSLIHKRDDRLYSLVTDLGFRKTGIMWESLDQLDGDTMYLDSDFNKIEPNQQPTRTGETDYEMALRLQFAQPTEVQAGGVGPTQPSQAAPAVAGGASVPKKKKKKLGCTIM